MMYLVNVFSCRHQHCQTPQRTSLMMMLCSILNYCSNKMTQVWFSLV